MAGQRQPVELLIAKGKKNLTKAEIEKRKQEELKVKSKAITMPEYLPESLQKEFRQIAKRLTEIEIFTDLDVDGLARYLLSKQVYLTYTQKLAKASKTEDIDLITKLSVIQDKAFKQCRSAANDLGLSITSRCKLTIPKSEEEEPDKMELLLQRRRG